MSFKRWLKGTSVYALAAGGAIAIALLVSGPPGWVALGIVTVGFVAFTYNELKGDGQPPSSATSPVASVTSTPQVSPQGPSEPLPRTDNQVRNLTATAATTLTRSPWVQDDGDDDDAKNQKSSSLLKSLVKGIIIVEVAEHFVLDAHHHQSGPPPQSPPPSTSPRVIETYGNGSNNNTSDSLNSHGGGGDYGGGGGYESSDSDSDDGGQADDEDEYRPRGPRSRFGYGNPNM